MGARRAPAGIRLLTRNGHDWAARYPLSVEAVNHLRIRSVLIDGEVVCCDERGLAVFHVLRRRQNEANAFMADPIRKVRDVFRHGTEDARHPPQDLQPPMYD